MRDTDPLHLLHGLIDIRIIGNLDLYEISDIFNKIGIGNHGGIHDGIRNNAALSVKLTDDRMPDRDVLYNSLRNHAAALNHPDLFIHIVRP